MRAVAGLVLGVVARLWLATLRVRLEVHPDLERCGGVPWVLAFFHGTQWPLLAWKRRRPTLVMVSHSNDGALQARALGMLGFLVVRGSSSRGGVRALSSIVRAMRSGDVDAAFAVDGPRGPYGEVKPGAALAARRAGGVVVPMGSAMVRGKTFRRAWDRFALAWPFTRVAVVLGPPVPGDDAAAVAEAIEAANVKAAALLAEHGDKLSDSARLNAFLGSPETAPGARLNRPVAPSVQRPGSGLSNWLEEEKG